MHHWEVGGTINIGWPDYGIAEQSYAIVEFDRLGQVFRARVTDGKKEGGFLVVFDCPAVVLEILAEQATQAVFAGAVKNSVNCFLSWSCNIRTHKPMSFWKTLPMGCARKRVLKAQAGFEPYRGSWAMLGSIMGGIRSKLLSSCSAE